MAKTRRFEGFTIHSPDAYRVSQASQEVGAVRSARSAAAVSLPEELLLAGLLGAQDLRLEGVVVLEKTRSATAEPEARSAQLDVPVEPGENAVVLVEEEGEYRWVFPHRIQVEGRHYDAAYRGDVANHRGVLSFEIDLTRRDGDEQTRLFGLGKLVDKVKTVVYKYVGGFVTGGAVKLFERTVERGIRILHASGTPAPRTDGAPADAWIDPERWVLRSSLQGVPLPTDRPAQVLLLVHGTFSSTVGSYGALAYTDWGKAFLTHAAQKYDLVIGFDHPTLSETPQENAIELLRLLQTARWGAHTPVIDAVGYSRGGLVLRSFVEQILPLDGWPMTVERAVFVGATNGGTVLASATHLHRFVDHYTNLAVGAARLLGLFTTRAEVAKVLEGLVKGLGAAVKFLASAAVTHGQVPGLAAMEPEGDFVRQLNETQPGQPTPADVAYYAVTSTFDVSLYDGGPQAEGGGTPGLPKRLLLTLADRLTDQLMREPNDLVVNTASMTRIDPDVPGFVRDVEAFRSNGQVYHTVYFLQPATVRALHAWLEVPGADEARAVLPAGERSSLSGQERAVTFAFVETDRHKIELKTDRDEKSEAAEQTRLEVPVEVVWGDITQAVGDVYAVGHYVGVLPQRAESALDHAISCVDATTPSGRQRLVLTDLTRRGLIRGELGDIDFFPWGKTTEAAPEGRLVAVCGMGHIGRFTEASLRRLYHNLVWELNAMPDSRTLCTVLIGSGEGGFGERASVRGLLYGLADALLGSASDSCRITRVRIVELFKDKAERIHEQLRLLAAEAAASELPIDFGVEDAVTEGSGGRVSNEHRLAMLIAAATRAAHREPSRKTRQHLDEFLDAARANDLGVAPEEIRTVLHELTKREKDRQEREQERLNVPVQARLDAAALAQTLRLAFRPGLFNDGEDDDEQHRTIRLTFRLQDDTYRVGALTYGDQGATLPEREIGVKEHTVRSLMRRMTAPSSDDVKRFGRLLYHTLVPREFREVLAHADQIIFEVDRDTAPIHWEMLMLGDDAVQSRLAGVDCRISRQLRSTYSAAPGLKRLRQGGLRALVIGDPGDPERGHHLANARREALAVEALFRKYGFEKVDVLVGAPTEGGYGPVPGKAAADYIEVFEKLINGRYEIVHYAGHGDYDAADPSRTGWLFKDDVLTAGEIERMEEPPALVFANACVSGRLSEAGHGGGRTTHPYGEAGLLPSVADEFFRRGVRNYIGTAWNVHDQGAIEFAENFYVLFLEQKLPICEAMQLARKAIRIQPRYGSLWAAYQHYGDPAFTASDL